MRSWHGYKRNPTWTPPAGSHPRWLPPHFNCGGMLEGTINDPDRIENQPSNRMERQLNMIQGQAIYLQGILGRIYKSLPQKRGVFRRPEKGLYE